MNDWNLMYEDLNWISVIISAIFSAIVGLAIAGYVKKTMKPKHEEIFDDNRQTNLRFIFNDLERFHEQATFIFNQFENDFGGLDNKRKELVTRMKWVPLDEISEQEPVSLLAIFNDQKKLEDLKKD